MPTQFALQRKKMPFSRVRLGIAAGFFLAALIAAGSSYADALTGSDAAPLSNLVKFGDREYEITAEDWVSLDPISSVTVRKIEFGRVSDIVVATTSTGTYSSEGMVSPHIRYPGITVRPVPVKHAEANAIWHPVPGTRIYTLGHIPTSVRIIDIPPVH